jgi:hypothetical protein
MTHLNRRIDPRNKSVIVDLSREAVELTLAPVVFDMPGFERRIAPVTKQELDSMEWNRVRHIAATQSEVAR